MNLPARLTGGSMHRTAAMLGLTLLLSLVLAGTALADSATITAFDTSGKPDPVSGVPRTWTVSGTTSTKTNVYIKYRNPGPTPCAPNAHTDSGAYWDDYGDYRYDGENATRGGDANGTFKFSDVYSESLQGTYMFCIWIANDTRTSVTAITQTITFRAPSGTISAAVNPSNPAPGKDFAVTINGVSEAPEKVFATVRPAGTPCAQTYDADYKTFNPDDDYQTDKLSLDSGTSVNGNFAVTDTTSRSTAGNYVACLWLADSSSSTTPIAGPQPIPFTVGVPYVPPPPSTSQSSSNTSTASAICSSARRSRNTWARRVTQTKLSLLKARHRSTRHRLTKRLKSQRHSYAVATSKAKLICSS